MNLVSNLFKQIRHKRARVGIIGIGYVGRALAEATSSSGFKTLGFSRSEEKVARMNAENSNTNFQATVDLSHLAKCDIIALCVPTPIHDDKTPDLRPLEQALLNTARFLRKGQLVIIESSIAAGTTRKVALPLLLQSGLKSEDFFLAFSPERVDPGNKIFTFRDIAKIVAGINTDSTKLAAEFYRKVVKNVVEVSNLETAEMAKLLENTFRFVNISLINELVNYTNALGVDIHEVISAASTKPFGFLPHYPGPGIGGHCIPVDPYYLLDDARKHAIPLTLIEQAGRINDTQPERVVERAQEILNLTNGEKKTHAILLIGISYKPDIDDIRESPALKIWKLLQGKGHAISYHDPFVSRLNGSVSIELSPYAIDKHDLTIVTTHHSSISYQTLIDCNKPILDTRNVFESMIHPNIFRL